MYSATMNKQRGGTQAEHRSYWCQQTQNKAPTINTCFVSQSLHMTSISVENERAKEGFGIISIH